MSDGERPDHTYYADENGDWLPGLRPQTLQQMIIDDTQKQTAILSHASDMIGAITDEIEGLEDSEEDSRCHYEDKNKNFARF
ncbi:TPA: hypothetical protein ACOEXB_001931 [Yersinia enterocolitica]